jgi:hypothetical protein
MRGQLVGPTDDDRKPGISREPKADEILRCLCVTSQSVAARARD